jgi:hypothetical protein
VFVPIPTFLLPVTTKATPLSLIQLINIALLALVSLSAILPKLSCKRPEVLERELGPSPEISGRGKNRASNLNLNSNVCPVLSAKLYELLVVASPVITSVVNGLTTSKTPSAPGIIGVNNATVGAPPTIVFKA